MNFKKLTFYNAQGQQLAARLDLPADGKPLAYALFAHCFTCSKNLKAVGHISTALSQQGIAVLRFDFTGLGESEGDFSETTFSSDIGDLLAAAQYLEAHYEAPKIMVGHSLGGAAVLQAAAQVAQTVAVATIGSPFNPKHIEHLFEEALDEIEAEGEATVQLAGRSFTIKKQFVDDLSEHRVAETLRTLRRALLIFHSPVDRTVNVEHAEKIFKAARHPKSFVSLDRADHLLTDPADSLYVGRVLGAWARKYIGMTQEEVKHPDPADNHVVARIGRDRFRTEVLANGHVLVADEPQAVGGTNAGPTPYDYLLAALGTCTAMTLRMYADHKKWPLEAASIRLHHQKVHADDCDCETKHGGKVDLVEREIEFIGPLDDKQRARLLEIANRCPVHRTLEGDIVVKSSLRA